MKWESKVLGSDGCCLGFSRKCLVQSLAHGTHLLLVLRILSPTEMTSFTNISGSGGSKVGEERAKRMWPQWLWCWYLPGAILDKNLESFRPQSATGMEVGKSDDIGTETYQEKCDILEVANKEKCRWSTMKGSKNMEYICCCSVTQSCPTLGDSTDCSIPGLSVPHHLPKFAQVHIHCISDGIQSSHPLLTTSPSVCNLSQCQGLFQWLSCSHQMTKILELQLQHQSLPWVFRVDFP